MLTRELDRLYLAHVADLEVRIARVLGFFGWDAVAIHSGSPTKRSQFDDQFWPLRPSPPFQHWVPLREPDCLLVLRPGRRPKLLRPATVDFWEGPPAPETEAFADVMDVVKVTGPAEGAEHVGGGRVAFVGEDPDRAGAWGIAPEVACPAPLIRALDALRTTKTPYEVACLAEANRRAGAGHERLRAAFFAGEASELDLHLLYLAATSQDDPETPYKNIVALGEHAATLHHVAYGRGQGRREAESLLVDAGATCRGYGSDITRTWVRGSGAAASAFAAVVSGLDAAQRGLAAAVRVGAAYEDLHDASHRRLGQVLRDAGVILCSVDEAVGAGVTRAFYPHGLGHSLGLQTHDVGCALRPPRENNAFLRNTSDIALGQTFTIEPGIYFIAALLDPLRGTEGTGTLVDWRMVDALAALGGARIEDDVLVLENGVRNLTREALPDGGGWVG